MKIIIYIAVLLNFGCTTTEQIERDKKINSLSEQVGQSQKLSTDFFDRLTELEQSLASNTGKIEELEHFQGQKGKDLEQELQANVQTLNEQMKNLNAKVEKALAQLEENKKFIDSITGTLKKAGQRQQAEENPYKHAMSEYNKGRFKQSSELFIQLLGSNQIAKNKIPQALHYIGLCQYRLKKNQEALIYFSKIYANHASSKYAPSALLHIGKSFKRLNKISDAKDSFTELVSKFPTSRHASTAKKELEKMK